MGTTNSFCAEEKRFVSHFHRIPKNERCYEADVSLIPRMQEFIDLLGEALCSLREMREVGTCRLTAKSQIKKSPPNLTSRILPFCEDAC